jgi:hypothetical protein
MSTMKEIDITAKNLRAMLSVKNLDDLCAVLTLLRLATENEQVMSHPALEWHREQAYRIKALVQDI